MGFATNAVQGLSISLGGNCTLLCNCYIVYNLGVQLQYTFGESFDYNVSFCLKAKVIYCTADVDPVGLLLSLRITFFFFTRGRPKFFLKSCLINQFQELQLMLLLLATKTEELDNSIKEKGTI